MGPTRSRSPLSVLVSTLLVSNNTFASTTDRQADDDSIESAPPASATVEDPQSPALGVERVESIGREISHVHLRSRQQASEVQFGNATVVPIEVTDAEGNDVVSSRHASLPRPAARAVS